MEILSSIWHLEICFNQIFKGALEIADKLCDVEIELQYLGIKYLERDGYVKYVRKDVIRGKEE